MLTRSMRDEILVFPEEVTLNLGDRYPLSPPIKIERGRGMAYVILTFEVTALRDHASIGEEFLFRNEEVQFKVKFKKLLKGEKYSTQLVVTKED